MWYSIFLDTFEYTYIEYIDNCADFQTNLVQYFEDKRVLARYNMLRYGDSYIGISTYFVNLLRSNSV